MKPLPALSFALTSSLASLGTTEQIDALTTPLLEAYEACESNLVDRLAGAGLEATVVLDGFPDEAVHDGLFYSHWPDAMMFVGQAQYLADVRCNGDLRHRRISFVSLSPPSARAISDYQPPGLPSDVPVASGYAERIFGRSDPSYTGEAFEFAFEPGVAY